MGRLLSADRFIASRCQQSYYEFFLTFWDLISAEKLNRAWYIKTLCDELQIISERVFRDDMREYDLVVNCPPGTSKSSMVSILWQPWIWTRMPGARFISGSHSERLSLDLSRKSRDVICSEKYQRLFPNIKLREDQNTKAYFANTLGGMRYATGVGGSVIGMHAHFLAIDDPLDPQGAMSDLTLEEANIWMNETLSRRKVNVMLTPTVLIMQRLHQDDSSGNMLARGTAVRHINLPADDSWEIKPPEFRQFYVDGLLDPVRLGRKALDNALETLQEVGYAGQYGECLVSGTMIQTAEGPIAIEEVHPGQHVATRFGYKKVLWSGQTKTTNSLVSVLFDNLSILSGTRDHLVWTENNGFVPLAGLSGGDYNRVFTPSKEFQSWADQNYQQQKKSHLMDLFTYAAEAKHIFVDGVKETEEGNIYICTERCGDSIVGASPLAMMSTTRMKTQVIIELEILNALLKENIYCGMLKDYDLQKILHFLRGSLHAVQNLVRNTGELPNIKLSVVSSVTRNSSPGIQEFQNSVLDFVRRETGIESLQIGSVRGVEEFLHQEMLEQNAAQRHVHLLEDGIPVYDLTVEDAPEFFANCILVHNCPVPRGGAMFKVEMLRFESLPPKKWKRGPVRAWDKAGTQSKGSAYSVGVKSLIDMDDRVWILDVIRGRWDSGVREKLILDTARLDGKNVRVGIEQEPGSGGKESAEGTLKRLTLAGYRGFIDKVTGDKEVRAKPLSVMVNLGQVILINALWNKDFVHEMRFFPRSKYKDQIDAAGMSYSGLSKARYRIGAF